MIGSASLTLLPSFTVSLACFHLLHSYRLSYKARTPGLRIGGDISSQAQAQVQVQAHSVQITGTIYFEQKRFTTGSEALIGSIRDPLKPREENT